MTERVAQEVIEEARSICRAHAERGYKAVISRAWQTGDYSYLEGIAEDLLRVRNSFGPSWLYSRRAHRELHNADKAAGLGEWS